MSECFQNFLSSGKFLVNLSRLPGVDFYCQSISTPDISINTTNINYLTGISVETSNQISYGNLSINFIVDESLDNYNQVLKWMKQIAPDESLEESKKLYDEINKTKEGFDYTDIELKFSKNGKSYIYKNCVPQNLSGLEFNVSEDLFITANITFIVPQIEIVYKS